MKIHQVVWERGNPYLNMNKLSSFECPIDCKIQNIGVHAYRPHKSDDDKFEELLSYPKVDVFSKYQLQYSLLLSHSIRNFPSLLND